MSGDDDCDIEQIDPKKNDPEHFVFDCLNTEEVEKLLNESVECLSNQLQITPSLAKILLHQNRWNSNEMIEKYRNNAASLLVSAKVKPTANTRRLSAKQQMCPVCITSHRADKFYCLSCGHSFCKECWTSHFEIQIGQGISTQIGCMAPKCDLIVPEDTVLQLLTRMDLRDKYQHFVFADYVRSHPQLRFCPGPNCQIIVRSSDIKPKRAVCKHCHTIFCFRCGTDYHAPTDCAVIKKWLTKCADDSETANYISAHTKDCPKCHICIEKVRLKNSAP